MNLNLKRSRHEIAGLSAGDSWQRFPSTSWMFVPLTEYPGGGSAATIGPLVQHFERYERVINSGMGCQPSTR